MRQPFSALMCSLYYKSIDVQFPHGSKPSIKVSPFSGMSPCPIPQAFLFNFNVSYMEYLDSTAEETVLVGCNNFWRAKVLPWYCVAFLHDLYKMENTYSIFHFYSCSVPNIPSLERCTGKINSKLWFCWLLYVSNVSQHSIIVVYDGRAPIYGTLTAWSLYRRYFHPVLRMPSLLQQCRARLLKHCNIQSDRACLGQWY